MNYFVHWWETWIWTFYLVKKISKYLEIVSTAVKLKVEKHKLQSIPF